MLAANQTVTRLSDDFLKYFLLSIILFTTSGAGFAQAQHSAFTKMFVNKIDQLNSKSLKKNVPLSLDEKLKTQFLVKEVNNEYYINAFMVVDEILNEADLNNLGIKVNTRKNNILTARIPVNSIQALSQTKGVKWIEMSTQIHPKLDSVRIVTKVNEVHQGISLPQGYTGEGVIIAITDFGFDLTHPVFFKDSTASKIIKVWDQNDNSGTPPAGFSYGTEFKGIEVYLKNKHTLAAVRGSHGTHVAGIAGGSGYLTDGELRGIAPDAEFIFVELGSDMTAAADAGAYIFSYAQLVKKPVVLNMSIGSHIGPHDGTSLSDQLFDYLSGPGKIFVGSAGNEGDVELHLFKEAGIDSVRTIVNFESDEEKIGYVDLWGSAKSEFSVRLSIYSPTANQYLYGPVFESKSNTSMDYSFVINGNDTMAVVTMASAKSNVTNQKPNIMLHIENISDGEIVLTIIGKDEVHCWNHGDGDGAAFSDIDNSEFVKGDINFSVGEIGGTGKSVLTVGAYTSKRSSPNAAGEWLILAENEYGDIAPFSSCGPTVDLRMKPEITAPGFWVTSAYSSYDETIRERFVTQNITKGDLKWPMGLMCGTSMAAPVITGVVALLLEENPSLTKAEIVNILKESAITDEFTGDISLSGSNIWGWGKADAHAALSKMTTGINRNLIVTEYKLAQNYPNPFNPSTKISFSLPYDSNVKLKVYNSLGQEVLTILNKTLKAGNHEVEFNAGKFSSGVYFCKIDAAADGTQKNGEAFSKVVKMMLTK